LKLKVILIGLIVIASSTLCSEENSLKNQQEAITQNNLGLEVLQSGNVEKAIEHFEEAIELDGKAAEYHTILGFCHFRLSNYPVAKKHYLKSIELDNNYFRGYYNLGVLLQRTNDLEGAVENYRKTLKLNPDYSEAVYNLALVSMTLGKKKEAIDGFEKFIKMAGSKYPGPAGDAKKRIQELKQ